MENNYVYEDDMTFDFVDSLSDDRDDCLSEAEAVQEAIIDWFQKMGQYNLYFKLLNTGSTPGGTYPFRIIGNMDDILRWNKEVWLGDEQLIRETAKHL